MATRQQFERALRDEIVRRYTWAEDPSKLEKFMDSVSLTLRSRRNTWNKDGGASETAWKQIGGAGKITYTKLRALPEEAHE